jgi:hypothetical protein
MVQCSYFGRFGEKKYKLATAILSPCGCQSPCCTLGTRSQSWHAWYEGRLFVVGGVRWRWVALGCARRACVIVCFFLFVQSC